LGGTSGGQRIAAFARGKLATKARALRDGKWATPKVAELVPGDVIPAAIGDIVPADARLLAGDPVQVDEAALTGESLPATRKPGEQSFRARSSSAAKPTRWFTPPVPTPIRQDCGIGAGRSDTVSHFQRAVLKIG